MLSFKGKVKENNFLEGVKRKRSERVKENLERVVSRT